MNDIIIYWMTIIVYYIPTTYLPNYKYYDITIGTHGKNINISTYIIPIINNEI